MPLPASVGPLLFGFTRPVDRATYAATGFGLMALKYVVEATLAWAISGLFLSPLAFLSPLFTRRQMYYAAGPAWVPVLLVVATLPFIWVGVSMSIRRARDAGLPAWFGLMFFAPILNFLMMLTFCALPSRVRPPTSGALAADDRAAFAAVTGVAGGTAIGLAMVGISVFGFGNYGATLFVGTPFAMGAVSGFLFNRRGPRSWMANVGVGVLTMAVAGGTMLLFALEGAICIVMAAPIGLVLALMGVLVGRAMASLEGRAAILGLVPLPLAALIEPPPGEGRLNHVVSVVDIAAPPEVVWENVIGFGGVDLPPPPEWFFQLGIAYPQRASIVGTGVGAVRYCEFSTGPFVEPITRWQAPSVLAFDVAKSPPTMHEWSPYEEVHAPHLEGILQSRHGEFRLSPLPDGGTRLEGHTWYTFDMAPASYWTLWSDAAIHRIHLRVLEHVRKVSETGRR